MVTIYFAENTSPYLKPVKELLASLPSCVVIYFQDGLSLYHESENQAPDLIITAKVLPVMGGLALARMIKFHEHLRKIPILMLSSLPEEGEAEKAASCRVDSLLQKPFQNSDVMAEIGALLALAQPRENALTLGAVIPPLNPPPPPQRARPAHPDFSGMRLELA